MPEPWQQEGYLLRVALEGCPVGDLQAIVFMERAEYDVERDRAGQGQAVHSHAGKAPEDQQAQQVGRVAHQAERPLAEHLA